MWYIVLSGLGIGLFGSFHCIGMCGPLALSLPLYEQRGLQRILLTVSYNMGRALTYALLGLLFGFVGQQFFLFGYQQWLTILAGLAILTLLIADRYQPAQGFLPGRFYFRIRSVLGRLLQSANSAASYFVVGMVNGLLPCGLVYLALGSAITTGNAWSGAALMFLFGMGTFPLMIAVMMFGSFISVVLRQQMRRLVPVFVCITALMMIVRGLNLGIPYLSPQLHSSTVPIQRVQCHP